MKYTVVWLPGAANELARIWLDASHRDEISSSAARIDSVLALAPMDHGESREDDVRVLFVDPLAAEYKVSELDRIVKVCAIWTTR